MPKKLDSFLMFLVVCMMSFSWLDFVTLTFPIRLIVSMLIGLSMTIIVFWLPNRDNMSKLAFLDYLRDMDEDDRLKYISTLIRVDLNPTIEEHSIRFCDGSVVVVSIGYGAPSRDYILGLNHTYRGSKHIYIVTPHDISSLRPTSKIPISVVSISTLYRIANRNKAIPKRLPPHRERATIDLKSLFTRDKFVKYFLVSVYLLVVSIFSPWRKMYLVLASVFATFSIFSLMRKPSSHQNHNIFI